LLRNQLRKKFKPRPPGVLGLYYILVFELQDMLQGLDTEIISQGKHIASKKRENVEMHTYKTGIKSKSGLQK
jgi:hypothetical protein